jgi:membrane-bound serine protease (ClpP class)
MNDELEAAVFQFIVPHSAFIISFLLALPFLLLLLGALLYVALLSRHRKAAGGALAPVNRVGSVTEALTPEGAVLVGGELWRARTRTGERVECGSGNVLVVGARGHLLEVEPRRGSPARSS